MTNSAPRVHLRLPATSANLGPAFDTAAVALRLHLEVVAQSATSFSISSSGRDAEACGQVERNLVLDTYIATLKDAGRPVQPLHLDVRNEIPLGMGCGSSAAARLAGIALAVEFGNLGWGDDEIIALATFLEGHPDNVTACWLGAMTVSAVEKGTAATDTPSPVHVSRIEVPAQWSAVVIFPRHPVLTEESRKVLPSHYSRADVVENLQSCSLLVAAFATGNDNLLRIAMRDRLHQPYRAMICPLLQNMEAITAISGVFGAALSGAGPGILLVVDSKMEPERLDRELQHALRDRATVEILQCGFENRAGGAVLRSIPLADVALS
jgi:homoserine kinase